MILEEHKKRGGVMTNMAKLKKDEAKYVEQIKWLEKMSKELQDNLFNVRAKMQEVSNG
tara:strand:- start:592 stop:765 length:174 start_codon:yes stop_codon:yes gene_type:complete